MPPLTFLPTGGLGGHVHVTAHGHVGHGVVLPDEIYVSSASYISIGQNVLEADFANFIKIIIKIIMVKNPNFLSLFFKFYMGPAVHTIFNI